MKRKILGLAVVFAMLFSFMSITAMAAGEVTIGTKGSGGAAITVVRNEAGTQVSVKGNGKVYIMMYNMAKKPDLTAGYDSYIDPNGEYYDNVDPDDPKPITYGVDFVHADGTDIATVTLPSNAADGTWGIWATHDGDKTNMDEHEVTVSEHKIVGDQSNLVFDLKGGKISGSTANVTKKVDAAATITLASVKPADPTKAGFVFGGWSETDGGTTAVTSVTSAVKDGTKTVYAIWNAKTAPTAADFTVTNNNVNYNAKAQKPTVTAAAGKTGMGTITVKTSETNAGSYDIKISVTEGTAYAATAADLTLTPKFTIKKIDPTVTITPADIAAAKINPGEEKDLNTFTISGTAKGANPGTGAETVTGTVAWTTPTAKVNETNLTHSWTFTPSGAFATNYNTKTDNVVFTVAGRAETHVTYGDTEVTYNGDPQAVTVNVTAVDAAKPTERQYRVYYTGTGDTTYAKSDTAPTDAGTYTVTVEMQDPTYNNPAETATLTIKKAKVTLEPTFTAVTATGKTLADAALTGEATGVKGEAITGTLAWDDDPTTAVEKNKSYGWGFTHTNANYEEATGSFVVWKGKASSSIGGGSGGGKYYDVTYEVGKKGEISGKGSESVKANAYPTKAPKVTAKDGYEFKGWSLDGKTIVDPTDVRITKDTTFTAIFESNKTADLNKDDHIAYVRGYEDGTFGPNKSITRAEAITIFARLMNEKMGDGSYDSSFNDVKAGAWYANYIGYMEDYNIINGYEDGSFRPDAAITRAEFAAMASRFDKLENTDKNAFTDVAASHWAINSINSAAAKGWIGGYPDGTFRPNQYISRAEVVSIVNNMLEREIDAASIAGAQYKNFPDVAANHWAYYDVIEAANEHDYNKDGNKETWK